MNKRRISTVIGEVLTKHFYTILIEVNNLTYMGKLYLKTTHTMMELITCNFISNTAIESLH